MSRVTRVSLVLLPLGVALMPKLDATAQDPPPEAGSATPDDATDAKASSSTLRQALRRLAIQRALAEPTTMEFIETPLTDVVSFLEEVHQIPIKIDVEASRSAGLAPDATVTCNLKGISLAAGLRITLDQLGLTYLPRDEVLMITTTAEVDERDLTRVFDVKDITTSAEEYGADALRTTLTEIWEEGIRFSIFRDQLVARGSHTQLEQVRDFLDQLRLNLQLPIPTDPHPFAKWNLGVEPDLRGMILSAEDLAELAAGQQQIVSLDLSGSGITKKGLVHLSKLPNLEALNFSATSFDDTDVDALLGLKSLRTLNLAETKVTDKGLIKLAALEELQKLQVGSLRRAWISPEGVEKFRELRPECEIIARQRDDRDPFGGGTGDDEDPFGPK